jgi:hypothetical protein
MTTLENLDSALATAKTALHAARIADGYAVSAWQNAMQYLGITPVKAHVGRTRPGQPAPTAPTPVAVTDLPGLASALIAANQALATAQANVATAQQAFISAQASSKIQS